VRDAQIVAGAATVDSYRALDSLDAIAETRARPCSSATATRGRAERSRRWPRRARRARRESSLAEGLGHDRAGLAPVVIRGGPKPMATLTVLESKIAEVLGLAMAAQDTTRAVRGMLDSSHAPLAKRLETARDEARETQKRCTALAGSFKGKKTAILEKAREVKGEATEMREAYLGGEDDPLDGFEFLTMAEAGEVGHWSIVAKLNERATNAELRKLTDWALPIQQRHFQEALDGSLALAADEDPDEEE
jgi:hypothetical protein